MHFELTVNTANIVENYATLTRSESLLPLVGDKAKLQHYAATTPIVDMVRFSPAQLDADALIGLLRPLTPRLYSIASSQAEVESEVHITVGVVRYDIEGRARAGGASSFLADRVEEEGEVRVFIEHNDNFRLPANPETPVIMIGPVPALRRSVPLCSSVRRTRHRVKTGCSSVTRTLPKISSIRLSGSAT
ncbi:sulfite reductase subunit alpha [Enterobacter cloacae]|uniref:Sulfite reductase subunit alpha n=1 Tax=Enterobacter cloacae TaxID=550 RepID=A0A377LVX0_ENTCL|nr:sulfite reductase subunit alpha [Enterobacter cloacae]